jgi:23S rRNA pseudouridine1911/1915/1917 synthase
VAGGFTVLQAGKSDQGQRVDVFLARKFGRSRSAVRGKLSGAVLSANDRPLKWSHKLRAGEIVRVRTREVPEPQVEVRFRILYQDEHVLAVDKGAGAPVHPVRSWRTRTVLTRLREQLGDRELKPAHRLDRETSGVLVFGRSRRALGRLMDQFKAGQVSKRYLAVVRGSPDFERIEVSEPLARDRDFPIQCRMRVDPERGQKAHTRFEVQQRGPRASLLSALPRTGRQHQIRVHLAHLGYPVLGDKLYQQEGRPYLAMIRDELDPAALERLGHHRQALHAERLEFAHPLTGDRIRLKAGLPDDLRDLLS